MPLIVHDIFLPYLKHELVIELEKTNHRSQRMPYNERNINKIYKILLNREIQQLLLVDHYDWNNDPYYNEITTPSQFPPDFCLGITCNYASTFSAASQEKCFFPNDVNFSLSNKVLGGEVTRDIQQQFIDLFKGFQKESISQNLNTNNPVPMWYWVAF